MDDEDGIPNKRGEAYCACRYLNCGRKFKSLKALEEHLLSYHNITWESYTRYSPTRHHETMEETSGDALSKRKDAYCMCTYMECGRKFKMLKNLEEHVTLYHNISWQLYTQYYHRSVRKTPEDGAKKCKSPKAEKKSSPYPAASSIKTSESPSPLSNLRSSSNGSATTPVSVGGLGLGSPVPASPIVSFMSQSAPTYGQYPYLTAQVPLVPAAIIQYQPMLTAPVIGYASPSTLPLPQGYLSQPTIPMTPLPENVSWFSASQSTSQLTSQQQQQHHQQDSGILNLSCPKSKKTRSSPGPLSSAKSLDLSTSSRSSSSRPSGMTSSSSSSQPYNLSSPASTARYLANCYSKSSESELRRSKSETWTQNDRTPVIHRKASYGNLPDTSNGVIVIEPDDQFDDAKYRKQLVDEIVRYRDSVSKPTYKGVPYGEEYKKRATASGGTSGHLSTASTPSSEFSYYDPVKGFGHIASKPYPHEEKMGCYGGEPKYIPPRLSGDLYVKQASTSLESQSKASSSFDSVNEPKKQINSTIESRQQTSHNHQYMIDKKSNEIFHSLRGAEGGEVRSAFTRCAPSSVSVKEDKCLTYQISSGLFHSEKSPPRDMDKCVDNHPEDMTSNVKKDVKFSLKKDTETYVERDTKNIVERESYRPRDSKIGENNENFSKIDRKELKKERCSLGRGTSLPLVKKLKRSASLPNLNIFSEDRLVIDITDEEEIEDNDKKTGNDSLLKGKCKRNNLVKKRKLNTECHLKVKSKPERDSKTSDKIEGVKTERTVKKQFTKLSTALSRTICIKRKYLRLMKKEVVITGKGSSNQNSSPFCKLILLSTPVKSNSCVLNKNCDTAKTTNAAAFPQLRTSRTPRPKRKMRIIRGRSTCTKSKAAPLVSPLPKLGPTKPGPFLVPSLKALAELRYSSQVCSSDVPKDCTPNKRTPGELLSEQKLKGSSSAITKDEHTPGHTPTGSQSTGSDTKDGLNLEVHSEQDSQSSIISKSNSLTCQPCLPVSYHRRRVSFLPMKEACGDKDKEAEELFSWSCNRCRLEFSQNTEYVRHRLAVHRTYRCRACDRSGRLSHLYRYKATLSRHLMLDHGKGTTALNTADWAIGDSYAGPDLHGVPFIENLDNLSLVTDDKIYTSDAVYAYRLQRGQWSLTDCSTTEKHQVAAPSAGETGQGGEEPVEGRTALPDETRRTRPTLYPSVLLTVTEALRLPSGKATKGKGRARPDKIQISKV